VTTAPKASAAPERDYVLGTDDEEIARLGLQHRVWRPRALDAWRRAGFRSGQTILDIGCGPGYASLDLAEIVGKAGRVVAIDRSQRFLASLASMQHQRGVDWITPTECDLNGEEFPDVRVDAAWARWVFAFVRQPRKLLERACSAIKPGGTFVVHEYFHYATWDLAPHSPELTEFVRAVMESWRAEGGEPDIGLLLPRWLRSLGFEVREIRPIIDIVSRDSHVWEWPFAFVRSGLRRLVELGRLPSPRAQAIAEAVDAAARAPGTLLVTPAVVEIIAVRT